MSTNYYLHTSPCPLCAHPVKKLHIGKSSVGWCFALATHPEHGLHDLDDWIAQFVDPDCTIVNEYAEIIAPEKMIDIITERGKLARARDWDSDWWVVEDYYKSEQDYHDRNHSERGPHGLLRHRLGPYCIQHGSGTWDCMAGKFS